MCVLMVYLEFKRYTLFCYKTFFFEFVVDADISYDNEYVNIQNDISSMLVGHIKLNKLVLSATRFSRVPTATKPFN